MDTPGYGEFIGQAAAAVRAQLLALITVFTTTEDSTNGSGTSGGGGNGGLNESETEAKKAADELFGDERKA